MKKRPNILLATHNKPKNPRPFQTVFPFFLHDKELTKSGKGEVIKTRSQAAAEKDCKRITRQQVMSAGVCESCEQAEGEQHHGIFKSNQRVELNRALLYDPDTQFDLCPECHKHSPDAPHVDNEAFLNKMTDKGGHRAYKAAKIRNICSGPLVVVKTREIDYNEILNELSGYCLAERECA